MNKAGYKFYIFITIFVFIILFPFIWTFISALKPPIELYGEKALSFVIDNPTLENFKRIFTQRPFERYLLNSTLVALLTTIYCVAIASLAAYAIARLQFKGKTFILGLALAVSMFPQIITLGPIYNFMQTFGLRNSYSGLIIPYTTFALPLAIWILTAFFRTIPKGLEEAAKIDGASLFQILVRVIFPIALPGALTAAIIIFINTWNEFLFALTINSKENMMTVPVGIAMFQGEYTIPWGEISAATIVVTIPLVIFIMIFQKRIISGVTSGAIKE